MTGPVDKLFGASHLQQTTKTGAVKGPEKMGTINMTGSVNNNDGFYPGLSLSKAPAYAGPESAVAYLDFLTKGNGIL